MNPLLDWDARFEGLSDAKDLIDSMGKEIVRLENMRPELSGTEQKAVDVALILLRKDAADATKAIQNADRHIPVLLNSDYKASIEKLRGDAVRLAGALHNYHRLVTAQLKAQDARGSLAHAFNHDASRNNVSVAR